MAKNPYTSLRQSLERQLLSAKGRAQNATSEFSKKDAKRHVQSLKEQLLSAKQRESNWNKK